MKQQDLLEMLGAALAALSAQFPEVRLIYLFGSRVEGRLGPLSDYDLAVLYGRAAKHDEAGPRLSHLLARTLAAPVDLVSLNDAPIELAYSVISRGQLLYERDVATRVEYEARIMNLYLDYLPVLRENRRDILSGGDHAARVQRYREAFRRTSRTLGQIGTAGGQRSEDGGQSTDDGRQTKRPERRS